MNVVSIHPETEACLGHGFRSETLHEAERFLTGHADCNLYWSPNPLTSCLHQKACKADVAAMACVHLDCDDPAPAVLESLRAAPLTPTIIVFSGGGYQAFWALSERPYVNGNIAEFEAVNQRVIAHLGGDQATFNIDRIMRLPGTMNWPTAKKRARGRVPVMAELIEFHPERQYGLDEFAAFNAAPATHEKPRNRSAGNPATQPDQADRSRDLLAKVGQDVRAGLSDHQLLARHRDRPHARDQADPDRAVQRCIDLARLDVAAEKTPKGTAAADQAAVVLDDFRAYMPSHEVRIHSQP